ncbi:hypothetical protein VULLAG_LOCUS1823 [Vulpes lagopus]
MCLKKNQKDFFSLLKGLQKEDWLHCGGDSCPVILLTDVLLQALFPEVDRRSSSAAVSSLPILVAPLVMDCFSLSFHPGETPQV